MALLEDVIRFYCCVQQCCQGSVYIYFYFLQSLDKVALNAKCCCCMYGGGRVRGGLLEFILCLCLCLCLYLYMYLYLYLYLMSPPLTLFLCHCLKMWFNFIALLISLFSKCSVLITANKVGHNPPIPCDASRNWYLPPSFCMFDILCACIQTHARDDLSERVWLGFVWYICLIIVAYTHTLFSLCVIV